MRKRLGISIAAAVAAAAFLASPASASTEVGWACTGDSVEPDRTLLVGGGSTFPISPVIPPEGPKVITGWGVWVGPGIGPLPQRLEVFAVQNEASEYKKIGESATETVIPGVNSFLTRIPVTEGNSVGLYGPAGTVFCDKNEGAISLLYEGAVATGETKPFKGVTEVGTPLRVVVEDDLDGDGYGDQSQDGCPESAVYQTDCPLVAIEVGEVTVKRRAILIEARVNTEASVEAAGEVRWWSWPKLPTRATRSTVRRPVKIGLGTVAPTRVAAGATAVLRVPLPKAVRRRLERLKPSRGLRARIDVKATNLVPYVGTKELKVRLPGRDRS